MSESVERFEDEVLQLKQTKQPETIPALVELKIIENKMT